MEPQIRKKNSPGALCEAGAQSNGKTQITVAFIALKSPHVLAGLFFGWELSAVAELSSIQPSVSFVFILYFCLTSKRGHDNPFVKNLKTKSTWKKTKSHFYFCSSASRIPDTCEVVEVLRMDCLNVPKKYPLSALLQSASHSRQLSARLGAGFTSRDAPSCCSQQGHRTYQESL